MSATIITMFVELLVMVVVGLTRYELRSDLSIRQSFNDRFFVFMAFVLSIILAAGLVFQLNAITNWFTRHGEELPDVGAVFCLFLVPFLFGTVLYGVGKSTSLIYKKYLVEKRTWLRELKKKNKNKK